LVGLVVLLGTTALWVRQWGRAPHTIYHWWGGGVIAVLSIHSLLEYPLYYAYFLGVAALVLGVLDNTAFRPRLRVVGHFSVVAILLLGGFSLFPLWQGCRQLEAASFPVQAGNEYDYERRVNLERMEAIQGPQRLFLRHYIELGMGESGWDHAADDRALNERVMRFIPTSQVVYREAKMLARAGRQAEAQAQIERAIWTYPERFLAHKESLVKLADTDLDPARYPALLEFALQKYDERQRAEAAH